MTTPEVTEVTPPRHRVTADVFNTDDRAVMMPDGQAALVHASLLAVPVYQSEEPKR